MVKAMLLKMGIAIVLMLLALGFTVEAKRLKARWLPEHFGKLPKGPVPPSAPPGIGNPVHFGKLPKGPVPPSAPPGIGDSRQTKTPPPPENPASSKWLPVHFEKLPKGDVPPPSGPSGKGNDFQAKAPPPPDSLANSRMVFQHVYLTHPSRHLH